MTVSPPPSPLFIDGLSTVISDYRGVILDLWGVVHDGIAAFPEACAAMSALRAAGIDVCLVSNAPRRVEVVRERLRHMGVGSTHYDHLITSGEETRRDLMGGSDGSGNAVGRRYYHLGPPDLAGLLDDTDLRPVEALEDADFVLCTGTDGDTTLASLDGMLTKSAERALPLICANPDLTVHVGHQLVLCAGSIAQRYESVGGPVQYYGKPYPGIYRTAVDAMRIGPLEVLAIGDSLRTDVLGAEATDMDAALVAGGVHREVLTLDAEGNPDPHALQSLCQEYGVTPRYVLPRLRW